MRIMETIKKMFSNQLPQAVDAADKRVAPPLDLGDAILAPGRNIQQPVAIPLSESMRVVALSTPVPVILPEPPPVVMPTPVVVLSIAPAPQPAATPYCPTCGQCLPPGLAIAQKDGQLVVGTAPIEDPNDPNYAPINWDDEQRVDLPMRTPKRIAFLLQHETEVQRTARIFNDACRYKRISGR
jgi:hypothetical protein